ncbi:MAG: exonuclease domain-containing protein [Planctomycetota bacterium]
MSDPRIAVIDLETTGLWPWRHDRIVEIAIVTFSPDGTILSEYETLVNPQRDIGPTGIHNITSAEILRAPTFDLIAGDVLRVLRDADVIAGHNVSFDHRFLQKAYLDLALSWPELPLLCTCNLLGRNNLRACCEEFGVAVDGMPHRALNDARATARLVSSLCAEDRQLLQRFQITKKDWPQLLARETPCYRREHAQEQLNRPPSFLQRLAARIHHDVDSDPPNVLAYMALIDRILEDRVIDEREEETVIHAAIEFGLTNAQLNSAHAQYLQNLAVLALSDGVITDLERRDLQAVARLLGQDSSLLDQMLNTAVRQLQATRRLSTASRSIDHTLAGKRICFTGELLGTIGGEPITRQIAEEIAAAGGAEIAGNVSKRLDLLVVADPNTQSGKARKARELGVRIVSEAVFWQMTGTAVD